MSDPTWISVLPPVLAVGLAIVTRQVYLSLLGGIVLGAIILADFSVAPGLADALDRMVAVLGNTGDARVILFTLVIGALIATIETAGGVRGFVHWLQQRQWLDSPRGAQLLAWVIGVVIFIESNITVLVAGTVARPLFDRHHVSREKLAYIIDSTSAPICILIPLNAWGAYNLGLLSGLGVEDPLGVFVGSLPYNFYALAAVGLSLVVVWRGVNIGPMKAAEARAANGQRHRPGAEPATDDTAHDESDGDASHHPGDRPITMLLPIAVMVVMMPVSLWVTGKGDLLKGSGSLSVLWAVLAGLGAAWLVVLVQRRMNLDALVRCGLRGAGSILPLAIILLLALTLGGIARQLHTGDYVAQLAAGTLHPAMLLPVIFVVAAGIAFSIGSSWGTFAIMLPIAVPTASAMGLPLEPFVAASLAGGVFGDHASPISDTTIVASMAAATDHIEHVRTQLPYALISGSVAIVGFIVIGITL